MFTEEGRWKKAILDEINHLLSKLDLDQLDEVLEFVRCQKMLSNENNI